MKVIIDLGLEPEGSIHVWDRDKATVKDEAGNTVGFVDENDGDGRVVVFFNPDGAVRPGA